METKKGFTLIELIVVVAIIAVLAAIVLVNVTQYINKSKDAAAKGNLATLQTNADIYYSINNSYSFSELGAFTELGAFPLHRCTSGDSNFFVSPCKALISSGYILTIGTEKLTYGSAQKWCAWVAMKTDSSQSYCVDSSGAKKMGVGETCIAPSDSGAGTCP